MTMLPLNCLFLQLVQTCHCSVEWILVCQTIETDRHRLDGLIQESAFIQV